MRRPTSRLAVVLALSGTVLGGCTSTPTPTPRPTPTSAPPPVVAVDDRLDVTVVLMTADTAAAGVAAEHREAVARVRQDVREVVDLQVAVGAGRAVQQDLLRLALDEGADVVCLVGRDAVGVASPVARERPDARVCAVADPEDPPVQDVAPSLLAVVPRGDELRAVLAAGALVAVPPDGLVGVVTDDEARGSPVLRALVDLATDAAAPPPDGLGEPSPGATEEATPSPVVEVSLDVAEEASDARRIGRDLRTSGAETAVLAGRVDLDLLRDGTRGEVLLVGPASALLDGGDEPDVLLAWTFDVGPVVRAIVAARLEDRWTPGTVSVGLSDAVTGVRAGGAEAGPSATRAVEGLVEQLVAATPGAAVVAQSNAPADAGS